MKKGGNDGPGATAGGLAALEEQRDAGSETATNMPAPDRTGEGRAARKPVFQFDMRPSTDVGFMTHPCVFLGCITKAISLDSVLAYICLTQSDWPTA